MRDPFEIALENQQAALFFLGQAGYALRACGKTVVIDPYLTDSVGKVAPDFPRAVPVPVTPDSFRADIYIVTHDHLDHLDPETIAAYRYRPESSFVAPRLAAKKLAQLEVPEANILRVDSGESVAIDGVTITGVYAVPTDAGVLDTTGYWIQFPNGRNFYHTSDTSFSQVLLEGAPKAEVLLACINGKWGNLSAAEAAALAAKIVPKYAIPNHYDMMALNSEDPRTFQYLMAEKKLPTQVLVAEIMKPLIFAD
jgi:L-ascorbate 6-phosphate lactonase